MLNRWSTAYKATKILVILVVLAFWGPSFSARAEIRSQFIPNNDKVLTVQADSFLDKERFAEMQGQAHAKIDPKACVGVRGGLVNHHVLATNLLWQFFQHLSLCQPNVKRLIILSPDHFFRGKATVSTAYLKYVTQGVELTTDDRAIDQLLNSKVVTSEPTLFVKEHGIGALVPFAAKVFPDAQIVPLAIRSDLSRLQANQLVNVLRLLLNQQTLLIVSSDMSHYLSTDIAKKKDQETLRALKKDDQTFFWRAKDDHLDLGKGLWIALRLLKQPTFQELDHAVSSDYAGSTTYVTTYLTGLWK